MNGYLLIIVILLLLDFVIDFVVDTLNVRHMEPGLPREFEGWYEVDNYKKSQDYLRETTRFGLLSSILLTPITLAFLLLGGFRWIDALARSLEGGLIVTGLVFTGLLMFCSYVVNLPFDLYSTFVLEQKYGFNKTTMKTFITDALKGLLLSALIGAPVLAVIIWFFTAAGTLAWLYCWIAVVVIQVILMYLAPAFILPLFNKFEPLEEGELKDAIHAFAEQQGFALKGIFTIDGSKRSTKGNAYFAGFGRWRRIVLYDTLVEKHSVEELVSVLAHEIGHYKLHHIGKQLGVSIATTGIMFYLLSFFISDAGLYSAFQVEMTPVNGHAPIYAGLVFFGFLYAPISTILSVFQNVLSRRFEYQADAFAIHSYHEKQAFIDALKRLSVDHLSNLVPHPLKVFLDYSHPPVLQRIKAIQEGG